MKSLQAHNWSRRNDARSLILLVVMAWSSTATRFVSNGPVLTVTLKDTEQESSTSSFLSPTLSAFDNRNRPENISKRSHPWFDLSNFRPSLVWSVQSQGKPLPNWLPRWHSVRSTIGYQYESMKRLPSFVEADLKFSSERLGMDVVVQPSYEFDAQRSVLLVQASRGSTAYIMGKLASKQERWLQLIRGCYQMEIPYGSVGTVRVTPTIDLAKWQASCLLEATTGSQRSKAVLNLEYDNPTLTVVHSLDERNTIAPTISLYNARLLYQWNIALDSGSIRTKVDPTSAIEVTWTDKSKSGKWVTDIRLPLAGTTPSSLAADVRVRRQFSF